MEFLYPVKGVIFQFTSYLLNITYDYKMILCYVTPVIQLFFKQGKVEISMIIMNYPWLLWLILHVNLIPS